MVRLALLALLAAVAGSACRREPPAASVPPSDRETVGRHGVGRTVLPVNQVVTPAGVQVELPGMRPQALALSPDGRLLITSGMTDELVVVDAASGDVRQRVALPKTPARAPVSPNLLEPDREGRLSYTGLVFSPDGRRAFLSDVNGSVVVFAVAQDGRVRVERKLALPEARAPRRREEIPAGLAVSADGRRLYVCGNLSNRLLELSAASGRLRRVFEVGVAPYDVVLAAGKAYVSNWGGRRPRPGERTGPAGRGTEVKVDLRQIASEGSVSVVDLARRPAARPAEVLVGLHASALAVSPGGRQVVCANAGSDTLSVIDVARDAVVETILVKPSPADLFGAQPNALAFDPDGRTLYVANGTQNAVAVVAFDPGRQASKLQGLIPVGWFPGALVLDAPRRRLDVANVKGHAPAPRPYTEEGHTGEVSGYNSHHHHGSLSLVPLPARGELPALSEVVWRNLRRQRVEQALLPPRAGQPARAVPERIGEPCLIRHVVYVIKENRTYDQVLGDLPEGNGDARLCVFGAQVTPNQHRLVRRYLLLDNAYCSGILSADGHQWSDTAIGTDYLERSFAGWPRSYPDGMGEDEADALAYSPAGFLWDNALRHGLRLRNYGEFMAPAVRWRAPGRQGTPGFLACFRTWQGRSREVLFASEPMVETIRPFSPTGYVGWELAVPDQYRADFILEELKRASARGELPQLVIVCLPNDHTSGTAEGAPTPAAMVADNDLAFGRLVEAFSRSPFWRETAIFAIEDDPQSGWDHVSGYRTTLYVASPYAKRAAVVSTQYNTTSVVRTIEQMLGLPPMNQLDASAVPLWDAFTDTPDLTPFVAVPANVPLDQMNPAPRALADPVLRRDALASARMDFRGPDRAPDELLNRVLWRAAKGTRVPYPVTAGSPAAD